MTLIPKSLVHMNPLLDFSLSPAWAGDFFGDSLTPSVDILDSADKVVVKAELPGVKKEEIEVSIQEGTLVLRGEKKRESQSKNAGMLRSERFYGAFYREIALPAEVDESKAAASYKNGVLELTLPKREEAKPKQIKIQVN